MMDKLLCAKIKKAVLAGDGSEIRAMLLNSDQVELVEYVKKCGTLRASLLSHIKGVSIQNASSKLNRLYTGGYLERTETSADSGGIEYFYTICESTMPEQEKE